MSRFEDPVIITCAISGVVANKEQCPAIPYTPEEYAQEARRAVDAGASILHVHARKPDGTPSYEVSDYRAITDAIFGEVDDVLINYSTGAIGISREQRVAHIIELKPELGALNMSSMNYAKYSRRRKDFVFKAVFENSFDDIIFFLETMIGAGVKPEHECFDAGHIANVEPLIDMGILTMPLQVSCILGVVGGMPPSARNLAHMVSMVPDGDGESTWEVIGISRQQWMLVAAALSLGGNVRVGLEDNLYTADGEMAGSNGDLVEQAARMTRDSGRSIASPAKARELLGVEKMKWPPEAAKAAAA